MFAGAESTATGIGQVGGILSTGGWSIFLQSDNKLQKGRSRQGGILTFTTINAAKE
jgi:hypothetical protein